MTHARSRRVNRLALIARDIEAGVEVATTGDRIGAGAHSRRQPACAPAKSTAWHWPAHSAFNVAANRLQPRFEALEQLAEQAEGVFGIGQRRECSRVGRFLLLVVSAGVTLPPMARDFTSAGSFSIVRARLGSRAGLRAKVRDGGLKRFDLPESSEVAVRKLAFSSSRACWLA